MSFTPSPELRDMSDAQYESYQLQSYASDGGRMPDATPSPSGPSAPPYAVPPVPVPRAGKLCLRPVSG